METITVLDQRIASAISGLTPEQIPLIIFAVVTFGMLGKLVWKLIRD